MLLSISESVLQFLLCEMVEEEEEEVQEEEVEDLGGAKKDGVIEHYTECKLNFC